MPSPMLLIHGRNLEQAEFAVRGHAVAFTRKQVSPNGHWAFLWLDTGHATPETVSIQVRSESGETTHAFPLLPRRAPSSGFAGFSSRDVMYLIMPDRFADGDPSNDPPAGAAGTYDRSKARAYHGGDLRGIEQHLDYLEQLGVTTVWVTPVYDNSANHEGDTYHGYSATDMYAVDPHLGTLADFEHLADALHSRGMKLVLDTVPNHVGPAHPWVEDEPMPDWFHGTAAKHIPAIGDFSAIVDPHGSDRDRIPPLQGWFADMLPDMNQENPLVATYLTQNAIWWVESAGLDGLRIDTFPYVSRSFWHDFHAQLHELYPRLTTVGEVFNEDPTIVSYFAGGAMHAGIDTALDTPFDYPSYFALRSVCIKGQPMTLLAKTLRQDSLYPHPERLVPFEGNHDVRRFLSEPGATAAELKLAFGLLATMRGMPEIYAGDEIAMEGGDDPDNRRDFPGGFPGDAQNAFTSAGRTAAQNDMHEWVSGVLALRRTHPAFNGGVQQEILVTDKVFAFARFASGSAGGERLLIVANNADQSQEVKLNVKQTALEGARRMRGLLGNPTTDPVEADAVTLAVPARSVSVYQVE